VFTFLHAADLHLDSPLRGLDKYEGAPVEEIRAATRRALENLVALAIQENVSFVVIAGDLYDGDWPDYNTGLFFVSQMVRLKDADISVYAVTGNHDAANRITKSLRLPDNVKIFSTAMPETTLVEQVDVAIHGQSFENQCTTTDLAKDYPAPVAGCFNIGVLHTSLSGREGHDSYAPCSEECLRAKGYDYWALGHVHTREIVSEGPIIAYPGNPQGRHVRETGAKGCLLVKVTDHGAAQVEFRPLDVFRWSIVEVDVSALEELSEVMEAVSTQVRQVHRRAEGLPLAVRIRLTGASPLYQAIQADHQQLMNDLRALLTDLGSGSIWVEKVVVDVTVARDPADSRESLDGPLQELTTYLDETRASAEMRSELGAELTELARRLPPELAHAIRTGDAAWWSGVLDEVEAQLVTRLRS
jgi:DNA repair exonuclease SbcCD nuclease subunit